MDRHVCQDCKRENSVVDPQMLDPDHNTQQAVSTAQLAPGRKRCLAESSEAERGPPEEPRSPSKSVAKASSSSEHGLDSGVFRGSLSSRDSLLISVLKPKPQPANLLVSNQPQRTKPDGRASDPESGVTDSSNNLKMDFRWPMITYLTFILVSLVLYMAELALHTVVIVYVYTTGQTLWFIILVVMLCAPSILIQVISFFWGTGKTECVSQFIVGFLHVLQLSIPWRYFRLICSSHVTKVDHELLQVGRLRLLQSFISSIPILIFEVFIFIMESKSSIRPELLAAAVVSWVSVSWVIATVCKREKDYGYLGAIMAWPNTCMKLIWRLGELGVRVLILALCVALQTYWIFMVLGLHWITMLAWLLLEYSVRNETKQNGKSVIVAVLTAYVYLFSYRNISDSLSLKYKPILFYCIMFFENTVLLVLWILYDTTLGFHIPISIAAGIIYVIALAAMVCYYNCFHMKVPTSYRPEHDTSYIQTCVNCKVSCCVKHNMKMEQPFNSHWWMEVKSKSGNTTSDYSDTMAPSDFSSVSKTLANENMEMRRLPPPGGRSRRDGYSHRPYMDDTFSSTLYTDSQYMSEYTVDSYYDTGSELVYHYRRRHAPDLLAPGTEDTNPNGLVHQRSDSGFSASLSLSDSKYSKQNTDFYTTDDSDVSNDPQKLHARMVARWRKHILQNAQGDASESDFFSQSSVASYPSSMPSRKALYYANRDKQLQLARVHYGSGVARRVDRTKQGAWSTASQGTVLGPLGLPTNRHRRHRGMENGAFVLDDKLDQIIRDVCNIEKNLKKDKQEVAVHHNDRLERYSDSDSTYIGSRRSYAQERSHSRPLRTDELYERRARTPDAYLDAALRYWSRPRTPDRLSVSSTVGVRSVISLDSQSTCSLQRDNELQKLSVQSKNLVPRESLPLPKTETNAAPNTQTSPRKTSDAPPTLEPKPQETQPLETSQPQSKEPQNTELSKESPPSPVHTHTPPTPEKNTNPSIVQGDSPPKPSEAILKPEHKASIELLQTAPLPQLPPEKHEHQTLLRAVWF